MTHPGHTSYGPPSTPSGESAYYGGSAYGSLPPPVAVIPSAPPPRRKGTLGIVIGIVSGVVVLSAIGVGAALFLRKGNAHALPIDAKMLPSSTLEIGTQLIEATRESDERVKATYLAAELGSEFCRAGARNPAQMLESLPPGYAKPAKDLFFDKDELNATRELLECGGLLAGSLQSPYQAVLVFEGDAKVPRQVAVGHFSVTEIPTKFGFAKFSYDGIPGFCRTRDDEKNPRSPDGTADKGSECKDRSLGGFAQGTTWFLGQRQALEGLAPSVKRPKEDLNASLSALKEAANQTEGLPVVRLSARPKSSKDFFTSPCLFGALHSGAPMMEFIEGCFPAKNLEKPLQEIDSKIKAAAYETDGDPQKAGAFHGNLVFVARDSDDAKDVEKDVKEVVSEWRSHIETNEARLINQSRESANGARSKKFGAVVDTYFKSLKSAKVARDGRTIRVMFKEALSAEDLTALEEADKTTIERRVAVAEVLSAIQAKRAVPEASLSKLVGAPWAKFLLGPPPVPQVKRPMTAVECKAVQSKISAFKSTDFTTSEARSMYFTHRFTPCGSRPVEVDQLQAACLASFKTATEYAKCAPPVAGAAPGEPADSEFGPPGSKK
ncbi:MAG TPA: hypothetical protein VM925_18575 [Labilithrix sp.]|nr:hypothetical protein [Labilithrix sp.]